MKIRELHLHGFGAKQHVKLNFQAPLTVIYGNNEAGKSTILGFIRAMLYGIPTRVNPLDRYEPIHGGVHGGQLVLEDQNGGIWTIERFEGFGGGSASKDRQRTNIRYTNVDGQVRSATQQELTRELLGGLSADIFRRLFAVSLTELQEIRTLQSDEVSGFLFHTGLGGGRGMILADRKLTQELDKLYRPRGRNQEMNVLLADIERMERDIRKSESYIQVFNDATSSLRTTEQELSSLETALHEDRAEYARIKTAETLHEAWLRTSSAEQELAALPKLEAFPEDAVQRMQQWNEELDHCEIQRQQSAQTIARQRADITLLPYDDEALARLSDVERSVVIIEGMEAKRLELRELRTEQAGLERELARLLRQIDGSWTEEQLRQFAPSIQQRERVRLEKERLASADRMIEGLHAEQIQLGRQLETAAAATYRLEQQLKPLQMQEQQQFKRLRPMPRAEGQRLWGQLQNEADRWQQAKMQAMQAAGGQQRALSERSQAAGTIEQLRRSMGIALGLLTLVLPLGIGLLQSWDVAVWILAALLVIDLFVVWQLRPRGGSPLRANAPGRGEQGTSEIAERISQLIHQLMVVQPDVSAELAASQLTSLDGLSRARRRQAEGQEEASDTFITEQMALLRLIVDPWLDCLREQEDVQQRITTSREQELVIREQLQRAEQEMEQRSALELSCTEVWESWLAEHRLPMGLTPDTVLDVFHWVEQGMALLQTSDRIGQKAADIETQMATFVQRTQQLLGIRDEGQHEEHGALEAQYYALRSHHAELLRFKQHKQLVMQLQEQVQHALDTEAGWTARMGQLVEKRLELLKEAEAGNEEELRRLAQLAARAKQLQAVITENRMLGFTELRMQQVSDLLQAYSAEQLAELRVRYEEQLSTNETDYRELQEQRGRLLAQLDHIREQSEHTDLLQLLAEKQAELRRLMDRYAVLAVCSTLLRRTRKIYEEEKQPLVLKLASGYFAEMTSQRYRKIVTPLDEKKMYVEAADGRLVDSALLSRGTAEQLYLAMRFALADSFVNQPNMPIMMDDLFVNFDGKRLAQTLEILKPLTNRHQVLTLTCHEHIAQAIMRQIPEAELIHLDV